MTSTNPVWTRTAIIAARVIFAGVFAMSTTMKFMDIGATAALAIVVFIGAWNAFLWPFLAVYSEPLMNITVGMAQARDAFGGNDLAAAMLTGLPMAIVYLLFQRRVTDAIVISAGIKG